MTMASGVHELREKIAKSQVGEGCGGLSESLAGILLIFAVFI
jgi:hypothetical protein